MIGVFWFSPFKALDEPDMLCLYDGDRQEWELPIYQNYTRINKN